MGTGDKLPDDYAKVGQSLRFGGGFAELKEGALNENDINDDVPIDWALVDFTPTKPGRYLLSLKVNDDGTTELEVTEPSADTEVFVVDVVA
jgi:hypothetical protein